MTRYFEHIAQDGDRWDHLAALYRGDAYDYEAIVALNRHVPVHSTIPGGTRLIVPVDDARPGAGPAADPGPPPWRRTGRAVKRPAWRLFVGVVDVTNDLMPLASEIASGRRLAGSAGARFF